MNKLNSKSIYKTCGEHEKSGTTHLDNKLILTNKIIINNENNINKDNFDNTNNKDNNNITNNNSLRRTCSLSIENNEQLLKQRRKRSNEPSTKIIFSSLEKQQRKGLISNEKQNFEKNLEKLTKENDLLKCKLEEQIRLNSVIVANPSLVNSINLSNNNNNLNKEIKNLIKSTTTNLTEEISPSQSITDDLYSQINNKELKLNEITSNISSSIECSNNILKKSERSAFSVIRAGTLVGNDNNNNNNQQQQQQISTSLHQTTSPLPTTINSFDLHSSTSLNSSLISSSPSSFFFPFYENREQLEFIRLASQLIPFSLFSQNQQYYNESNNNSIISNNLLLDNSSQQKLIYEQSNQMNQNKILEINTTISNSKQLNNEQLNLFSQPLILDTLEEEKEEEKIMKKENFNKKYLENELNNKYFNEEIQEIPIDFSVIKCGNKKYLNKNNNINNNNRPKSVICTSNSILNNEFLNENKSFLNICSTTKNTETSTFNNILEKAFESSPNHSNIQGCSHSIITKDNLNSFNCSERKTINATTKRIEEKNQQEQEQQQQPSSSQQCTSTFSELIINSFSTSQSTPTTTTTSSHSSSSNSMLGTLLAAPNKRQISPTVPASRTELFSGLTEFQRNEIKIIENEQNKQQTSKFSSSNICQIKKVSISSSSDSEHSTNQHSPTSLHSNISRLSPNSSTFPGISNSITIGGGGGGENDRIRRDVESLQNNYQANLLNNGQHLIENTLKISENVHQQLTDNENCINSEIEGEIGSIRIKLKTNEELERYMDRRRRNNEAAKRCRANRRAVFEYRSRRAQMLEAENGELRQEMIKLNNELEQLKALIAANAVASAQQSPQQQNQRLMHKT